MRQRIERGLNSNPKPRTVSQPYSLASLTRQKLLMSSKTVYLWVSFSCSSITTESTNEPQICKTPGSRKRAKEAQESASNVPGPHGHAKITGERTEERESGEARSCQTWGLGRRLALEREGSEVLYMLPVDLLLTFPLSLTPPAPLFLVAPSALQANCQEFPNERRHLDARCIPQHMGSIQFFESSQHSSFPTPSSAPALRAFPR